MMRLHVLLIEDSQDDAELILVALTEGGFDVTLARVETGEEMREALQGAAWDVVISDFNLPRFSAVKALALLRESGKDIPFIIVSGCIGEESAVALMKEGCSDFVMKDRLARLAPAIERELREAAIRREHRKAQEALLANEKLLKGITASLGEGVIVLDDRGRLVFMNPEAERLLGWTVEELLERDVHGVIRSLNQDGMLLQEPDHYWTPDLLLKSGMRRTEEDVFWCKNGSLMPVSVVASAMVEEGKAVAAVIVFQDITERKQADWERIESGRRLRELTAYFEKAREEERTRIARELHDELGQMLMGIKLDAKWLESSLPADIPAVSDKMASMFKLIDETVDAMRRVAADLRPVMLDDLGLIAAVEWLTEEFGRRTGIAVSCKFDVCDPDCCNDEDYMLDKALSTAAFRIVQECLTNVGRHAKASKVEVMLKCSNERLMLQVLDDGKGMSDVHAIKRNSFGILGMQERARGVGGSVEFYSTPGAGMRVEVSLPVTSGEQS